METTHIKNIEYLYLGEKSNFFSVSSCGVQPKKSGLRPNHLGNVHLVLSDRKQTSTFDNTLAAYEYYPFGMAMQTYETDAYRYGFNGKEKDDEWNGSGNSYDFGARIYDSRLGCWLSLDPLMKDYPSLSDYNYVSNSPINAIDPDGRLIIFINGMWGPIGGVNAPKEDYWSGYSDGSGLPWIYALQKHWGDNKALFFDGAPGGQTNIKNNFFAADRIISGYSEGYNSGATILSMLDEGETIKYITNSMGAAFQRGFSLGLQTYVNEENERIKKHNSGIATLMLIENIIWDLTKDENSTDYQERLEAHNNRLEGLKSELKDLIILDVSIVVDIEPYQETARDAFAKEHYYVIGNGEKNGVGESILSADIPGSGIKPVVGATDASKSADGRDVTDGHHSSFSNVELLPKPK